MSEEDAAKAVISIHALRKESDRRIRPERERAQFQSTLSVRRATVAHAQLHDRLVISIHALRKESDYRSAAPSVGACLISIHALRKESDSNVPLAFHATSYFNPRSP